MKPSLPQEAYDSLADAYAAITDEKPHNAYYERPATRSLIGDVTGETILDAGCGPGAYTEWLLNRGAKVVALDANEKMLAHARKRNGDRATYHCANLEEPLSFLADQSFDGILCALAISYVRDHVPLFRELRRVLRTGGAQFPPSTRTSGQRAAPGPLRKQFIRNRLQIGHMPGSCLAMPLGPGMRSHPPALLLISSAASLTSPRASRRRAPASAR